jgi:hypothetical protein
MKQIIKFSSIVLLMCTASFVGHAKSIKIDVSKIRGDLAMELRDLCSTATYKDTVVLNFGKGTYTIDATIDCQCNVIIKGKGRKQSKIVFNHGHTRNGKKAYTSDAFIKIHGTPQHTIGVDISSISFGIKEHDGIWWENAERFAVKIYHANHVNVHDVDSYLENAYITNFDLRVCSNVTFFNNTITNYNNCETGGCLWLRGEMHNITIKNNKFYKYGKDETLAFFGRVVDSSTGTVTGSINRTNIMVEGNEFYYGGYKRKDPEANCSMVFSYFSEEQDSEEQCTTRNLTLRNNKFNISDVTQRCIYLGFNHADRHNNILIENNQITNSVINREYRYYHQDIEIHDASSSNDTIRILNNKVQNNNTVIDPYGASAYAFLRVHGGTYLAQGNKVANYATVNPTNGKAAGIRAVWCGAEGGSITLRDNVFKGLYYTGYFSSSKGCEYATFNAYNNYFSGDTRIYCNNIRRLDIDFKGNTLDSDNTNFFLQEFANLGSVTFSNNLVNVKDGHGELMTHWSKESTDAMRFDRLEVTNNVLKGVKNETELLKNITNVNKRKVRNNRITR